MSAVAGVGSLPNIDLSKMDACATEAMFRCPQFWDITRALQSEILRTLTGGGVMVMFVSGILLVANVPFAITTTLHFE